jgi:multiple sugar transport system permease protein
LATVTNVPGVNRRDGKPSEDRRRRSPALLSSSSAHRGAGSRSYLHLKLLAPILLFEGAFVLYPIVKGVILALQQTNFGRTKYVGLANFRQMIHDPYFWGSIRTTFEFTLSMVVVWLTLGLAVALLTNWSFKGRTLARGLLAIPWAIPDVPTVVTFVIMLDPNFGIINRIASFLFGVNHHILWFSAPTLAFTAITMMIAWKGFPFFGLVILSSLQAIPDELYEAAMVDGAGVVRRFRKITLPALMPTLSLLALLAFIFSFQQFTLILLTTGGGPGQDTSTIAIYIYNTAFQYFNYNYAAAMGVAGLVLAMIATVLFVVLERRVIRHRYLQEGLA